MLADHGMLQRAVLEGDLDHLPAGFFHGFLHGNRHLTGLALAHADAAVAITDHGQRGEAENPATLHHLGDAVDGDHLLAQTVVTLLGRLRFSRLRFCHC
jgi:hypothetical protein